MAAVIDLIVLLLWNAFLFFAFSDQVAKWSLPPFCLIYYGLLNSKVTGGQTIGKRFFQLCVTNRQGQTLSIARSFLRTAPVVYFISFLAIGPQLIDYYPWLHMVLLVTTVVGTVILPGFLLSRRTIGDVIAGAQVVSEEFKSTKIDRVPLWSIAIYLTAIVAYLSLMLIEVYY